MGPTDILTLLADLRDEAAREWVNGAWVENPWWRVGLPDDEAAKRYRGHHGDKSGRFLEPLADSIDASAEHLSPIIGLPRLRPAIEANGVFAYTYQPPGSSKTALVVEDSTGSWVVDDDFNPSMEYPGIYPNGFWLSPDGRHIIHSRSDPRTELGTSLVVTSISKRQRVDVLEGALFPSGSWVDNETFVYSQRHTETPQNAGGAMEDIGWNARVLRLEFPPDPAAGWGMRRREPWDPLPSIADEPFDQGALMTTDWSSPGQPPVQAPNTRYDYVRGPLPGTVVVLAYDPILNRPQSVWVADLEGGDRGYEIQQAHQRILARVRTGPRDTNGRADLFILRLDNSDAARDGICLANPPSSPMDAVLRRILKPQDGEVIRQFEVLDRGPNKAPALALYIRRRGAQAQVDIVDLENNPDAPSNYRVADRWTVDLPGQPVRSRIPGVEPTGVFGEITTMTVTNGPDGRSRLNIEYSSFGSITHQHWRLDNIERGAPLRHVAGADLTERDRLNIARTHVDVHRITAEGGRTSWMHVIRPADVPVDKVLPVVYVAYPYYDLSQRKDYLPHMSELIRLGCAVAIHDIYGSGADGPSDQLFSRAKMRERALEDMRAGVSYLNNLEGIDPERKVGLFQSAGGVTAQQATRHLSHEFSAIVTNRGRSGLAHYGRAIRRVHANEILPQDNESLIDISGGITENALTNLKQFMVMGAKDFRIAEAETLATAAAFEWAVAKKFGRNLGKTNVHLISQPGGHALSGAEEPAQLAVLVAHVAGALRALRSPRSEVQREQSLAHAHIVARDDRNRNTATRSPTPNSKAPKSVRPIPHETVMRIIGYAAGPAKAPSSPTTAVPAPKQIPATFRSARRREVRDLRRTREL